MVRGAWRQTSQRSSEDAEEKHAAMSSCSQIRSVQLRGREESRYSTGQPKVLSGHKKQWRFAYAAPGPPQGEIEVSFWLPGPEMRGAGLDDGVTATERRSTSYLPAIAPGGSVGGSSIRLIMSFEPGGTKAEWWSWESSWGRDPRARPRCRNIPIFMQKLPRRTPPPAVR